MNAKARALKKKSMGLLKAFKSGQKVVGSGRYTVALGKSKSGPCKICRAKAGTHNIGSTTGVKPPYHPNCKCGIK